MKAVILAAGKGTRMRRITDTLPKPLTPVGGKRLLEWIVSAIRKADVHEFVIVTGYLAQTIEEYFGNGAAFGVDIQYVRQEIQNGTAGALRLARNAVGVEPFLLTFGDILASFPNYPRMIEEFRKNRPDGLLAVNQVDDPHLGAAVYFEEPSMRITQIVEKPPYGTSASNWNQAGLFIFDPCIFSCIDNLSLSTRGEYELTEAVAQSIAARKEMRALKLSGYRCEIGAPEDLEWMENMFRQNPHFLEK
ncbi:MAG: nucleotidyltransferase family protein [Candidatus Omnitrophota bacterium]